MVVAVTGSRGFRRGEEDDARSVIRTRLEALSGVTELRTGAAWGVDTVACEVGLNVYRKALHVLYVPAAPHNTNLQPMLENAPGRRARIIEMPKANTPGAAYKARNVAMVTGAELLVAFPSTGLEQIRSGTWMTVRIARVNDIPIAVVPLDGTQPWTESGIAGERRVSA